jgi:hypothetical protein
MCITGWRFISEEWNLIGPAPASGCWPGQSSPAIVSSAVNCSAVSLDRDERLQPKASAVAGVAPVLLHPQPSSGRSYHGPSKAPANGGTVRIKCQSPPRGPQMTLDSICRPPEARNQRTTRSHAASVESSAPVRMRIRRGRAVAWVWTSNKAAMVIENEQADCR